MSSTIPTEPVAFILQVKITIDPANRAAFLQHFKPVYDVVVAEPECAYFVMGENMQEPGVFRWTEGWKKDAAWFMSVITFESYTLPLSLLSYVHTSYEQK